MNRLLALVVTFALVAVSTANARPLYLKGFIESYPALEAQAKEAKCTICHPVAGKNMVRNDYGMAIGKFLEKKNEKAPETIRAALDEAAAEKNAKGTSFGELIEMGKLPNE